MKISGAGAIFAIIIAILLNGCGIQDAVPDTNITDLGNSGKVDYSGSLDFSGIPVESEESYIPAVTVRPQTTASSSSAAAETEKQETPVMTTSSQTIPEASTEKISEVTEASSSVSSDSSTTVQPEEAIPETDFSESRYTALNYSEVKGVWISYIELAEILQGKTADEFRKGISSYFDNCTALGINTVYVHVRSHGDAYYRSELFPWTKYATGTIGADPGFDPLEIMLDEAHSRKLSFQAWINPLRACGTAQLSGCAGYPVYSFATAAGMAGKYAVDVNGTYYLNPAYDEVVDYIAAGAAEIVANYDVDGLHIDDYFYPTTDSYFDSSAYNESGASSLSDFRLANCDRMVSALYSTVKKYNPTALFSVSVQGRIENNYTQMYADVRKWCTEPGYLDMMIPQIYYGFENSAAPYQSTLDEWNELGKAGNIPIVAGLSVSKVGCEDKWAGSGKNEWINNNDIISRQLATARECSSYGGFSLYSYRSVFYPESTVSAAVSKEITALKELI